MTVYAADVTALMLRLRGDIYDFGAEASYSDPHPEKVDCSEATEWTCGRLRVIPHLPDGSYNQLEHCRRRGTLIPVQRGITTQAALLFMQWAGEHHVALSLGNGSTIEARGRAYGVNVFPAWGRPWNYAALIPGVTYARPPHPPRQPGPPFPGRFLVYPPMTVGADVLTWQRAMNRRHGWALEEDRQYGQASESACRVFQHNHHLQVDGVVGPATWAATFR